MDKSLRSPEEEFSDILLRVGSIKFGTFELASGILSPYYVDMRLIPSDPEAFGRVIGFYSSILKQGLADRSKRIGGIPTAGIAYAAILALNFKKPLLYVRKETKLHGRERRIEGLLMPGDRVLILDDVVATGKNIIEAADAVRAEGGIVDDAVVLLDRLQGAEASLKKVGVTLHSFSTIEYVMRSLAARGIIDSGQLSEIEGQITQRPPETD